MAVPDGLRFGTYTLQVDARPDVELFTTEATFDAANEAVDIQLIPVPTASSVTINIDSIAPDIENTVPAGTTWSVSQDGTVLDSGTIDEALALPQMVEVADV